MPKNAVTDPITDPEIAFAHLLLSGTMNDREAAEAAGLNPTTAAYTKAKPRVREYMDKHRAALSQKLIDQESEGLRRLNLGRDQILTRLWQLANLSPEQTKGSIAGQIKAMAMIAAIEGFLPNRIPGQHQSSPPEQPAFVKPQIYVSEWMREREENAKDAKETKPATPPAPEPPPPPPSNVPSTEEDHSPASHNGLSWVPNAVGPNLSTYSQPTRPAGLPLSPRERRFGRGR